MQKQNPVTLGWPHTLLTKAIFLHSCSLRFRLVLKYFQGQVRTKELNVSECKSFNKKYLVSSDFLFLRDLMHSPATMGVDDGFPQPVNEPLVDLNCTSFEAFATIWCNEIPVKNILLRKRVPISKLWGYTIQSLRTQEPKKVGGPFKLNNYH